MGTENHGDGPRGFFMWDENREVRPAGFLDINVRGIYNTKKSEEARYFMLSVVR
jgi:hypothetical protein